MTKASGWQLQLGRGPQVTGPALVVVVALVVAGAARVVVSGAASVVVVALVVAGATAVVVVSPGMTQAQVGQAPSIAGTATAPGLHTSVRHEWESTRTSGERGKGEG